MEMVMLRLNGVATLPLWGSGAIVGVCWHNIGTGNRTLVSHIAQNGPKRQPRLRVPGLKMSTTIVTSEMLASLPLPVRKYLELSRVPGRPLVSTVIVKQSGRVRQSSKKPWMPFRATETYSLDPPGFIWNARAGRGGFPFLTVRDSYVGGKGAMRVKVGSLVPCRGRTWPCDGPLQRGPVSE